MARRPEQLGKLTLISGGIALSLILMLGLGSVGALVSQAGGEVSFGVAEWAAVRFTLLQALISALLSVLLAIPVARALARRRFPGRTALVTLLGAPFLLPAIVAVIGLTAVWGRSGLLSDFCDLVGFGRLNIYGLGGVVLGHVFFNLPLATRILLQGWASVPAEHWRLVAQLGMSPSAVFRRLERPILREVLPGAFLLIFLLCMTSFAVALTLGGGPGASTIELAIYQALRFDFDLGRAALLAILQFTLCLGLGVAVLRISRESAFGRGLDQVVEFAPSAPLLRAQDAVSIIGATAFLVIPLLAVVQRGLVPLVLGLPTQVFEAALTSLAIAIPSGFLALLLGFSLAGLVAVGRDTSPRSGVAEVGGLLTLAASPFVVGTGLFIVINPIADPFSLALPVTMTVNALMALPFVVRIVLPALVRVRRDYGTLADALGMKGWSRFRFLILPRSRRAAGFALGLSVALSMGDLGVVTLFAPAETATLPLSIYRLMSAYRMDDAAGAALLLLVLSLFLFWLFDRGGRLGDHV